MRTESRLKWAMVAVFGISGVSLAQVKPDETIQVGGGVYAVVDRVELTGRPTGFTKQLSRPMPYEPREMCPAAGPTKPQAADAVGLANSESSGLLAAILKMRLVGPPHVGTQNYGGSIEFALANPCPAPIAVPIVEADALHDYLPKEGRFEAIQVLFMALAGGDGVDAEFSGGYPLAGSPNDEKTYRILKQGEAVVLVAPIDFNANTMPQYDLERALESLRLIAWFGRSYWNGNGQIETYGKGWSIVCDHDSVPVEVAK
jgi:hypothetical protein